jgi:hypothetical protein
MAIPRLSAMVINSMSAKPRRKQKALYRGDVLVGIWGITPVPFGIPDPSQNDDDSDYPDRFARPAEVHWSP